MFGSVVLDVAIGLLFVYWLFASLCSAAVEVLAAWTGWRAARLKTTLETLLGDPRALLQHPLVGASMSEGGLTYIAPDVFANALLDLVKRNNGGAMPKADDMGKVCDALHWNSAMSDVLRGAMASSGQDAERACASLARWFDHAMEGASASYKEHAHTWILVAAIVMTLGFNIDTVHIADTLWQNPIVSARVVDAAQGVAARGPAGADPDLVKQLAGVMDQKQKLGLPLGWSEDELTDATTDRTHALKKITGLLLSICALRLGAPFWFDLLNRLVGLRRQVAAGSAQ